MRKRNRSEFGIHCNTKLWLLLLLLAKHAQAQRRLKPLDSVAVVPKVIEALDAWASGQAVVA